MGMTFEEAARERDKFSKPDGPVLFGIGVIAVFIVLFSGWSAMAPVSGAAIAEGAVHVEGRRQAVQHAYGGIVRSIAVKDGDAVEKGQLLIELFDAEPRAALDVLTAERDALLALEARLVAERDDTAFAIPHALKSRVDDAAVKQALANEQSIMAARGRQVEIETSILNQKIAQLREQARGATARLSGLERQKSLLEEEMQGARHLLASGHTPRTRVLALERDLARIEADRGTAQSDLGRAQEEIGEAELAIARLDRTRLGEIADLLRTTQARLAETAPKLDAARDVLERTRILAPASGVVVGLSVFTEGGVIQPGANLLDIVPSGNGLFVEARLHLSDVNEVTVGRRADIRVTGVNRSERPQIGGEVITVSADRLMDEKTGQGFYSIAVRMDEDDLRRSRIALRPGMPVEVIVPTQPRTLVQYLLSPLLDEISGSFRER